MVGMPVRIQNATLDKHKALLAGDGDANGWSSAASQAVRFQKTLGVIAQEDRHKPFTILDVGCGTGRFAQYLRLQDVGRFDYTGIDVNGEMIAMASDDIGKAFARSSSTAGFRQAQIEELPETGVYDYIVASGIFGIPYTPLYTVCANALTSPEFHTYFVSTLRAMLGRAKHGVAFNCLSSVALKKIPGNAYVRASSVIHAIENYVTGWYKLDHSYRDNDMTFHLFHDQQSPRTDKAPNADI